MDKTDMLHAGLFMAGLAIAAFAVAGLMSDDVPEGPEPIVPASVNSTRGDIFYPPAFNWSGQWVGRGYGICDRSTSSYTFYSNGTSEFNTTTIPGNYILNVWVNLTGDDPAQNLSVAEVWLRENLGVRLSYDVRGLPVYMTRRDIVDFEEDGSANFSAAGMYLEERGIAAETRFPDLTNQIFAHELGHMLGLDHQTADPSGLMYPHATDAAANMTGTTVTDAERSIVKNITTLDGITGTWAARSCVD